jgi:hypothetical protein
LLNALASVAQDYVRCKGITLRVEISKLVAHPAVIFKKSAVGLFKKRSDHHSFSGEKKTVKKQEIFKYSTDCLKAIPGESTNVEKCLIDSG